MLFSDLNVTKFHIIVCSVRTEDNTRAKPRRLEYKFEIQSTNHKGGKNMANTNQCKNAEIQTRS
jgi:hypothetical protein